MLINTSEGTFGTVTLMPQDTATGELSYVLIVQPSATNEKNEVVEEQNRQLLVSSTGEEEQDQDLTVYDFDDAEEGGEMEQMVRVVHDIYIFIYVCASNIAAPFLILYFQKFECVLFFKCHRLNYYECLYLEAAY